MIVDTRIGSVVELFHVRITGNSVGFVIVHIIERTFKDRMTRGLHLPAVIVIGIFKTPSIKGLVGSK